MKIRIAGTESNSIVDGVGLRYVIFTQGCNHHCLNCHNPETWDKTKGQLVDINMIKTQIEQDSLLTGVTLSGGEPFLQARECLEIAKFVHKIGLSVWCYTGYTIEELYKKRSPVIFDLLEEIDVLVDGPFENDKKSYELKFRGSSNQRLIDVKRTMKTGKITEVHI